MVFGGFWDFLARNFGEKLIIPYSNSSRYIIVVRNFIFTDFNFLNMPEDVFTVTSAALSPTSINSQSAQHQFKRKKHTSIRISMNIMYAAHPLHYFIYLSNILVMWPTKALRVFQRWTSSSFSGVFVDSLKK